MYVFTLHRENVRFTKDQSQEIIMFENIHDWMAAIPIGNPLRYRQARLLQTMLLIIFGSSIFTMIVVLLTVRSTNALFLPFTIFPTLLVATAAGIILLRRGQFSLAVYLVSLAITLCMGVSLIAMGFPESQLILFSFAIPITLAGLLVGQRAIFVVASVIFLLVVITGVLHLFAPTLVGFAATGTTNPVSLVFTFVPLLCVLSFFLDRFGSALRNALYTTQAREKELDHLRVSLESTVAERTASLQEIVNELRASQQTIQELSAPIMPVLPGVLVAPLIGIFDNDRAKLLNMHVLQAVNTIRATYVIFDITGISTIDPHGVQLLLQTAEAVRLLGAQPLLVGVRAHVAQTIIMLDINTDLFQTYATLQEAVTDLLDNPATHGIQAVTQEVAV